MESSSDTQTPYLDDSLWGPAMEITDFYPYIADGQIPDNIDWDKLDFDDASEYYSKKFNKFPDEIIEILNNCHNKELKKLKAKEAKKKNKEILKLSRGVFTINFD